MRILVRLRGPLLTLALALASVVASAQADPASSAARQAEAERLFNEALDEMDNKQYTTACPKLEASTKIAPSAGGPQIVLAECYEKTGRLASAWRRYGIVKALPVTPVAPDRASRAESKQKELEPKLARLTLRLPVALRGIRSLKIRVDDVLLNEEEWDKPYPVDTGDHTITLSATAYEQNNFPLSIKADGELKEVRLPALVAATAPTMQSVPVTPIPTVAPTAPVTGARSKVPGFIVGGVGVAAAIVGAALVGVASSVPGDIKSKQPDPRCKSNPQPGENAICSDLRSQADAGSAMGNAGVGILVGGGVLIAAGVLWLVIPPKRAADRKTSQVVPIVGKDGGGLIFTGSF